MYLILSDVDGNATSEVFYDGVDVTGLRAAREGSAEKTRRRRPERRRPDKESSSNKARRRRSDGEGGCRKSIETPIYTKEWN